MPLTVHFLNVGQGDCTIIEFPSGRVGMVDIDNLDIVDDDTAREVLEEYQRSAAYLVAKALGRDVWREASEFFSKQYAPLTNPLAYYDTHIGRHREIFRLLITHPDMPVLALVQNLG